MSNKKTTKKRASKSRFASIRQTMNGELILMRKHRSVETGMKYCRNYISYYLTGKIHNYHVWSKDDIYLAEIDPQTDKVIRWIW